MGKLGISLYPDHSHIQDDLRYLDMAKEYGFTQLFVCLLNCENKVKEDVIATYQVLNHAAKEKGFEVIFDVSPTVFDFLDINYENLMILKNMGADVIRLDESFHGFEEAIMTQNPYGIKIEINASVSDCLVDQIMSYQPSAENLITCHNYYPLRYSGLGVDKIMKMSQKMKKYQLRTAAFISSQTQNAFGPWPLSEGLCTLEMHRSLPIDLQLRHLKAMGCIDDIRIGNAYASEFELKSCQRVNDSKFFFNLQLEENSRIENEIIYDFDHHVRGDMSDYMIRSTMPRIKVKNEIISAHHVNPVLHRGDVVIINDSLPRYKGELHICLKDMVNDGRGNVVGFIPKREHFLFDYLKSWQRFAFLR